MFACASMQAQPRSTTASLSMSTPSKRTAEIPQTQQGADAARPPSNCTCASVTDPLSSAHSRCMAPSGAQPHACANPAACSAFAALLGLEGLVHGVHPLLVLGLQLWALELERGRHELVLD
mmetsp:Transcript_40691/g.121378  ORF Transcript_40691/g.121378 Transcript_40691/m.121378 type:complete len:121 (-) Transcript_40691:2042-2404(-)